MDRRVLVGLLLGAAFFSWGYLSSSWRVFPHEQIQAIAAKAGFGDTVLITPRSDQLSLLRSLPYVRSSFDTNAEQDGVLIHERGKAFAGYTFWSSSFRNSAALIDMEGNTIHEWHRPLGPEGWHHAELLRSGEILVVVEDQSITKLTLDSEIVWQYSTRAHHSLSVTEDGTIYALSRDVKKRPKINASVNSVSDKILILRSDGTLKDELSIIDIMQASKYSFLLPRIRRVKFEHDTAELDVLHANHVEVADGRLAHRSSLYKRGNMLVSLKHINSIAIIDGDSYEITWLWGPTNIALQHHSILLENGNILLFDNGLEKSRVLELNPINPEILWQYGGKGLDHPFYSSWGGANQRLPNGNTLITETATGYGLEVTRDGEIVWKFANPEVDEQGLRTNIWRMTRFAASELEFL